jgi:hypothetical protein
VGPKTMQLLKAMRGQLGDTSASRSVDAVAAAEALGMDTTTHDFDRRLQDLVRAGYLEPVRKAQQAAKRKPETGTPKPADEMTDANLGAEVKPIPSRRRRFVCTTFFRIPRLCNRTLT